MKARSKANIFLKILGRDTRGYHLLSSRFILLEEPYDELYLSDLKHREGFEILSEFACEDNSIQKAYDLLCLKGFQNELEECFRQKSLVLIKNIPRGGGLGGSSTDAASFLMLVNEELNLKLSKARLLEWSRDLGSDVAFFLSGYQNANVSGCGELICPFEDEVLKLELIYPGLVCETAAVYKEFDRGEYDFKKNEKEARVYEKLSAKELLSFDNFSLNDLFAPCIRLYPQMRSYLEQGFFLSGSGSTVFKVAL